jgi:uncharacterized membrane protein
LIGVFLAALAAAAPCPGQCQYEVAIIQAEECEPWGYPSTTGLDLNESGHVVGYYKYCVIGPDVPFLWTPDTGMIDLPLPPDSYEARADDINNDDQVVGLMIHNDYGHRGFIYDDGEYTVLPPVIPDSGWSYAMTINDHAQVVGYRSITEEVNPYNAFVWSAEDGFTDLGVMEGPFSSATDILDSGVVVGWTGTLGVSQVFLWEDGEPILLGPVPGGFSSAPGGINNRRQIAGAGRVEIERGRTTIWKSFLWEDGSWTILSMLPGYDGATARDLNDVPQIVGQSNTTDNPNVHRALLWQQGEVYDLNDLAVLDPTYTIERAFDINNRGQIVADGNDAVNDVITFVLTPIDRPEGDIDGDCDVDVADLLFLLGEWGKTDSLADINGDGIVNVADLLILLGDWGT